MKALFVKYLFAVLAAVFLHAPLSPAVASSEGEWEEFRQKVTTACSVLAAEQMTVDTIRVDPFGTESYGIAIITGRSAGPEERVCVYHKAADVAELSGAIPQAADVTIDVVSSDSQELAALPGQVRRTLDEIAARGLPSNGQADTVAAILDGSVKSDDVAATPPGSYRCTVYWYGFLDEGVRKVGTHACTVGIADRGLTIEKTTGERLSARTVAMESGTTAYYGRSFLPGHQQTEYDPENPANRENANFGNKVGIVLRSGERLFLVSIDERGMSPSDRSFFEIMELVPQL
jgi:hypothetical protein